MKKQYIEPSIKVKEIEAESLLNGESLPVNEGGTPVTDPEEVEAKPMYGDFNVWEK